MHRSGTILATTLTLLMPACAAPRVAVDRDADADGSSKPVTVSPDIDRDADEHWRNVDLANTLIIRLAGGDVVIELAPQFAPAHVEQMRRLARAGHYESAATFYRVIDNFVAQGGVLREVESADEDAYDDGVRPLDAEFERPIGDLAFVRNASADLYAPETGHIDGFAVGHDPKTGMVWPLHCYGVVAMARDTGPDTGSSHFYIVNGRDQRYLDRNLTIFGRVIAGMEHVQRVNPGDRTVDNGVIPDPTRRTPILGIRVAADLPPAEQPRLQVMRSESPAFAQEKERRFYRDSEFFALKPKAVEACAVPAPVREAPEEP